MRIFCWLAVVLGLFVADTSRGEDDRNAQSDRAALAKLEAAEGYQVELAAGSTLVEQPMFGCFDDRGRLFVTERGSRIRALEDTDGDGTFDKSVIFADNMTTPGGALWLDGALYVISAPYLWRLEDTTGDGVADRRDKILGSFEAGERASQFGPFLGPCGRLFFTAGNASYDLVGVDGTRLEESTVGSVFSCRTDGTDVRIEGQGPRNPVEVAFTAEGEMLSTAEDYMLDRGWHDALVHWIHGSTTVQFFGGPRRLEDTGERLPVLTDWGGAAPAGLLRYRGKSLGGDMNNSWLVCLKHGPLILRETVDRQGATFRTQEEVFLGSSSRRYSPTDVLEDADGSVLLIDSGFEQSSTSRGAIYRIRKQDAPRIDDAWGLALASTLTTPEQWIVYLDDSRPAVRDRAMSALVKQGAAALPALRKTLTYSERSQRRRNAIWVLSRIASNESKRVLREALTIRDASVRLSAVRAIGELADGKAAAALSKMVVGDDLALRCAAATALGKIGRSEAVPALVQSLESAKGPFVRHALIYALIQINDSSATLPYLASDKPQVQRGVLIALDQMASSQLTYPQVAPLLESKDRPLRLAAIEVLAHHQAWASDAIGVISDNIKQAHLSDDDRHLAERLLTSFFEVEIVQTEMASALAQETIPVRTKVLILKSIETSDLLTMPRALGEVLGKLLESDHSQLVAATVEVIWAEDTDQHDERLLQLSRDEKRPVDLRLTALSIAAKHGRSLQPKDFDFLQFFLSDNRSPFKRMWAAESIASAGLTKEQTMAVVDLLAKVGPRELPVLLRRFERDSEPQVVNVDAQMRADDIHLGLAAFKHDPQGPLAYWNIWLPTEGRGIPYLRTSNAEYSGLSLSPIEGSPLQAYVFYRFDDLMGDFIFNGDSNQQTKHQANRSHFTIRGLKPSLRYDLYYYGSAYPKPVSRGAEVTVTDQRGAQTKNIRGVRPENVDYEAGLTHALFQQCEPRSDGTIQIDFTAARDDTEGNFGILNGLTVVLPPAKGGCDKQLGLRLVRSLEKSDALASLSAERLKKLLERFPKEVLQAAGPLLKRCAAAQEVPGVPALSRP